MTTSSIKNSIILITATLLFSTNFLHAQAWKGDTWTDAKTKKTGAITFAYVETPGISFKDATGRVSGITVDIMYDFIRYVDKVKGVKLNFKFEGGMSDNFKDFYTNIKGGDGGVFGLGNIAITDTRKKEVSFSPGYIHSFPMLISHNSVESLKDLKSMSTTFKFMKAYVAKGTMNDKRTLDLKSQFYRDLTIIYTASCGESLQKIMSDDNSFGYIDVMFYLDAVKKKLPIKRHSVGDKGAEEFGIIMPPNSDWEEILKEFFEAKGGYKNSPEYKKIIIKHLGISGAKLLEAAPKNAS